MEDKNKDNEFTYDFQPEVEHIALIGIQGTESSGREDNSELWGSFKMAVLLGLKHLRVKYPDKYKSGLHIYLGEYNDHLWLGFNNSGSFLADIFSKQFKELLPEEYFVMEETTRPPIPLVYSYYPERILSFSTDNQIGKKYKDEECGTLLEITSSELFPENMRKLV